MDKESDLNALKQAFETKISGDARAKTIVKKEQVDTIVYNKIMLENLAKAKDISTASASTAAAKSVKFVIEDDKIRVSSPEDDAESTPVSFKDEGAPSKGTLNFFGIKINMKGKVENYKEQYRRNYVLARSHNLLIAKFAELKLGFYSAMLSFSGVTAAEMLDIQRESASSAIKQNLKLYEENEFASELLAIVGGARKYVKMQKAVIKEIRMQLTKQCENLGLTGYFTKEKVREIQLDQCRLLVGKFAEEKMSIEYELCLYDSGIVRNEERPDIIAKMFKINGYLAKANSRLDIHLKAIGKETAGTADKKDNEKGALSFFS